MHRYLHCVSSVAGEGHGNLNLLLSNKLLVKRFLILCKASGSKARHHYVIASKHATIVYNNFVCEISLVCHKILMTGKVKKILPLYIFKRGAQ